MSEELFPLGHFLTGQQENNNNPLATNHNISRDQRKRKRKRLSAVLDKLHNNNNGDPRTMADMNDVKTLHTSPEISHFVNSEKENEDKKLRVNTNIFYDNDSSQQMPSPLFGYFLHSNFISSMLLQKQELITNSCDQEYSNTTIEPQEQPLDLSMKAHDIILSNKANSDSFNLIRMGVPVIKGDVASSTTTKSVATRYNLNVSPVVEEMPEGSDVAYVCPICGQMFSLHDRLAKHIASRHKNRGIVSDITKSYVCEVCDRSFARSDMLTRHMRLHTGIKPYTCKVCGQVFSRSDHLSTHQRTHTGEKPYRCPQCAYAACRRDMITRHMRTHSRYDIQNSKSNIKYETVVIDKDFSEKKKQAKCKNFINTKTEQ